MTFALLLILTYKVSVGGHVVELPAERYVAGVLAGESSVFRNEEALKAMAVAARTYAARMRGRHAKEGFDFCATTHCQRLDLDGINERVTKAAAATEGELLWFEGKPVFSVYSRNCGGRTEVWPDLTVPYLRVQRDPYCRPAAWTWSATPRQLILALKASGLSVPDDLVDVSILERTASGRAKTLALMGKTRSVPIAASSFRFAIGRALGWNTLRSEQYEVHGLHFRGKGQGHGAGLCQNGADTMAGVGKSYREILAFYYPGTQVSRTGVGVKWTRLGGEGVSVWTARPERDGKLLAEAEHLRRELHLNGDWEIRVYPDVDTFRNATGEPGWVAAHTSGRRIDMQANARLKHEMLHGMVESRAVPGLPLWFREGLVEWLDGVGQVLDLRRPLRPPDDADIRQRDDRARAQHANDTAKARVAALVNRYGETAVIGWLERGLPAAVKNSSASNAVTNSK
jgi:stage II sporulation protein D